MYFTFQTCRIVLYLNYSPAHALFSTAALIPDFMYRCVLVGLLLTFYCNRRATAAPPSHFFLVGLCCLTRVEGSLFRRVRKQRVHEVWWLVSGAFSDFFLFYTDLDIFFLGRGGEWGGGGDDGCVTRTPQWHLRTGELACLYRVVTCTHFIFVPATPKRTHTTIFQKREWTLSAEEAPRRAWCPLCPPPLLHSPYLPPLFARQPPCSARMRGHPPLLGWRKGVVWPERSGVTRRAGYSLCFCFLCIFSPFQCDFPGSGWVEMTF